MANTEVRDEAKASSDPANDCHARSKERNAQRHPGTAAALAAGNEDRCLHAGDSGKREGNDRSEQQGTEKAVTEGTAS